MYVNLNHTWIYGQTENVKNVNTSSQGSTECSA